MNILYGGGIYVEVPNTKPHLLLWSTEVIGCKFNTLKRTVSQVYIKKRKKKPYDMNVLL